MERGYAQQMEDLLAKLREIFYPSYGIPLWVIFTVLFIVFVIFVAWRFANWRYHRLEEQLRDEVDRRKYSTSEMDKLRERWNLREEALLGQIEAQECLNDLARRIRRLVKRSRRGLYEEMLELFNTQEDRLNQLATLFHGDVEKVMRFISLSGFMASSTITPAEKVEISGVLAKMMEEWGTPENPDGTPIVLANLAGASTPTNNENEFVPAFKIFTADPSKRNWEDELTDGEIARFLEEMGLRMEDIRFSDTQDGSYYTLTILYPKRIEKPKS